jgi:hypothetical protein
MVDFSFLLLVAIAQRSRQVNVAELLPLVGE